MSPLLGVCIWYWDGESIILRGSIESRGIDFCSRHAPDLLDRSSLQLAASRQRAELHERQIGEFKNNKDQKYTYFIR